MQVKICQWRFKISMKHQQQQVLRYCGPGCSIITFTSEKQSRPFFLWTKLVEEIKTDDIFFSGFSRKEKINGNFSIIEGNFLTLLVLLYQCKKIFRVDHYLRVLASIILSQTRYCI